MEGGSPNIPSCLIQDISLRFTDCCPSPYLLISVAVTTQNLVPGRAEFRFRCGASQRCDSGSPFPISRNDDTHLMGLPWGCDGVMRIRW